jgi:predicted nucleotidyltransferase component of viral defense system
VSFEIRKIKNIRDVSEYDDYRASLIATFQTIHVTMKIDITTGDAIIPHEIEYPYKLMFENRYIPLMAYNLTTILAEKVETIISRGVANTRARDFYDVYILLTLNGDALKSDELFAAIRKKAEDRDHRGAFEDRDQHLHDIMESPDIAKLWQAYCSRYPYAQGIKLQDILALIFKLVRE